MPYDVSLVRVSVGVDGEVHRETIEDVGNYTSNVRTILISALGEGGIHKLHGKLGYYVAQEMSQAISFMTDPERISVFKSLEPENGWGSYEGTVQFLREIMAACQRNPLGVVEVYS